MQREGVVETVLSFLLFLLSSLWSPSNRVRPASRRPEIGFVFACSIPPSFVLSHNMPMINTTSDLALFGAFLSPPAPFPRDSRTTIHSPLASPPTFHAPRSSGSAAAAARRAGYSTLHPAGVNML